MLSHQPLQPLDLIILNNLSNLLTACFYVLESLLDLRLIDGHVFVELPLVLLQDVCEVFNGGFANSTLVALVVGDFRSGVGGLSLWLLVHLLVLLGVGWKLGL